MRRTCATTLPINAASRVRDTAPHSSMRLATVMTVASQT